MFCQKKKPQKTNKQEKNQTKTKQKQNKKQKQKTCYTHVAYIWPVVILFLRPLCVYCF